MNLQMVFIGKPLQTNVRRRTSTCNTNRKCSNVCGWMRVHTRGGGMTKTMSSGGMGGESFRYVRMYVCKRSWSWMFWGVEESRYTGIDSRQGTKGGCIWDVQKLWAAISGRWSNKHPSVLYHKITSTLCHREQLYDPVLIDCTPTNWNTMTGRVLSHLQLQTFCNEDPSFQYTLH